MAKSDVLHDHPRSKKAAAEQREAKKGDRKIMSDQGEDGSDIEGEYESIGTTRRESGDPERIDMRDLEESSDARDKFLKGGKKGPVPGFNTAPKEGGGREIWRRREKKEDVPTS